MKYDTYSLGAYNLHIITTKQYKTVTMLMNFKERVKRENITARNLISYILSNSTKDYPTKRTFYQKKEDLYGLTCSSTTYLSGHYNVMKFTTSFLNETYTEEGMLFDSLQFIRDLLLNPNIENQSFSEETVNQAKNYLKEILEEEKNNPKAYSIIRLKDEMLPKSEASYHANGYLEDLDDIDGKTLYQTYESMIKTNTIDIFLLGDVNSETIKRWFQEHFSINTMKKKTDPHFLKHTKFRQRSHKVIEEREFQQSKLAIGCKVEELTTFEQQYVLIVYNFLLGGSPDSKLFQTVREKNSLCYYISSTIQPVSRLLLIQSGINREDFNKAVTLIKKEMKNMQAGKIEEADIEQAKLTYLSSCKGMADDPIRLLSAYVSHIYMGFDLLEKRMEEMPKVTKEQIVKVAKKVHLDTIYLLEGSEVDE